MVQQNTRDVAMLAALPMSLRQALRKSGGDKSAMLNCRLENLAMET
jgi:hypothetical protein